LKVIRQGIVLWAQLTQDALGVLIDVLEPDWGMPAGVETVEPPDHSPPDASRMTCDTAYRGAW
jgi:hypothetical protein